MRDILQRPVAAGPDSAGPALHAHFYRFLDRMSDKQFYHWTRRVILALGAVYIGQGLWLMVTR